ncbi:2-dehydropantoate 2-reductase [Roseomonas sp. KE2513]|uniref:2-dehydropantoate 2-reductase n=1 Tax=Roseomonas sp. KE2513 TaxID=2479202 RepID=UPI0018DFAD94|nr:2-dehydropantoate 2-reductase [Roseomonas sp. KE2513]MBI0538649.1 2-dehydropantoate 2-reductase [Roseomonas sp. KE2513]
MRVAVLGAGAIGGWLAAGLARAGNEVGVLARGASLAALRRDGLVLSEGERSERFAVTATDDPAALAGPDLLLLGLKGQDLPGALPLIRALLGPNTQVVAALNGLPWWFLQGFGGPAEGVVLESVDPGGRLVAALPASRVVGAVVHAGSRVEAPGRIRLMKADRVLLGDPGGAGQATTIAEAFRAGGIPAEAIGDIRGEVWNKLWGNSNMNTLGALARADVLQLLDDDGTRGLALAMMREMADLGERIGLTGLGDPEARIAVTRRLGAFRTSMVQDLEAGRAMELGPILGALVELGARLGQPVPTLAGVHGLLRLLALNLGLAGKVERR